MKKNITHLTTEIVQKVIIVVFWLFFDLFTCFVISLGSQSRDRLYRQIPLEVTMGGAVASWLVRSTLGSSPGC